MGTISLGEPEIAMEIRGTIEEITGDGRYIVTCSEAPEIGDQAFRGNERIGHVGRVFGPVSAPYASVTPDKGANVRKGQEIVFKGRKRDAKGKRRNRGD